MIPRTFLVGTSGSALTGSALYGFGAFSRVEATRGVRIEGTPDREPDVDLQRLSTSNSQHYADGEVGYVPGANPNGGDASNANSALAFATTVATDVYARDADGYRHSIVCPERGPLQQTLDHVGGWVQNRPPNPHSNHRYAR